MRKALQRTVPPKLHGGRPILLKGEYMSRKTKRHKTNTESQSVEMSSVSNIGSQAKQTLDSVLGTINSNKLLIGSIAAGCGAALFLWTTDSGKRMRTGIQDRTVDLYDLVSEQVTNSWDQLR